MQEIRKLVLPILERQDVELVDLLMRKEKKRDVLQFLVDKPGGVTLNECVQLNQQIDQLLEGENLIQESYCLEVCSPGLDRPLKDTKDFQRAQDKLVKIVLHQPLDKQNVWRGYLREVNEENIVLSTQDQQKISILRSNIARANFELLF